MVGEVVHPATILVVAHRGYSARWPENTVAGAEAAILVGADLVEADARLSADGDLFCIHDPDLTRLAGVGERIAESGADSLRRYRIGNQPLARFDDIVGTVKGRAGLLVDVKVAGVQVLQAVRAVLARHGWPADVWLGLRWPDQVVAAIGLFAGHAGVLALIPDLTAAPEFRRLGAHAVRVWEQEIGLPQTVALRQTVPIWVTAGMVRSPRVGETDIPGVARITASGATAVLLNDPTLVTASRGSDARASAAVDERGGGPTGRADGRTDGMG